MLESPSTERSRAIQRFHHILLKKWARVSYLTGIADAVVVTRYLGATLVLPDIRGSKPGYSMSLGDIYDVREVLNSLDGLVRVTRTQPAQVSNGNPPIVRVPNRVFEDYIVKVESYFPSFDATTAGNKKNLDSFACQAMFGTLQLQSEIQVVEFMVQKLQTWSQNLNGQFFAVDLRTEVLGKECHRKDDTGRKLCYQAQEIGVSLKNIGFSQETAFSVTEPKWNPDLHTLRYLPKNLY